MNPKEKSLAHTILVIIEVVLGIYFLFTIGGSDVRLGFGLVLLLNGLLNLI